MCARTLNSLRGGRTLILLSSFFILCLDEHVGYSNEFFQIHVTGSIGIHLGKQLVHFGFGNVFIEISEKDVNFISIQISIFIGIIGMERVGE